MSLELLGAISPDRAHKNAATARAKTAGQRAIAAGQKIAKRAPRLSKSVIAAGKKAMNAASNLPGPRTASKVAAKPGALAEGIASPGHLAAGVRPGVLPPGTVLVPAYLPAGVPGVVLPRGSYGFGRGLAGPQLAPGPGGRAQAPVLTRPSPGPGPGAGRAQGAAGPQLAQGGAGTVGPRGRLGRQLDGARVALGAEGDPQDDVTATDEAATVEIWAGLADAAAVVAGLAGNIQWYIEQLPPALPLIEKLQRQLDWVQGQFVTAIDETVDGTRDVSDGTRWILKDVQYIRGDEKRTEPTLELWRVINQADAYLQRFKPEVWADLHKEPDKPADKPANAALAKVVVDPPSATVALGTPQKFTALTGDAQGNNVAPKAPPTWAVSPGTGASIAPDGTFVAQSAGSYTVTATADGVSGSAQVTVQAAAKDLPVPPPPGGGGGGGSSGDGGGYDGSSPFDGGAGADPFAQEIPEEDPFAAEGGGGPDPFAQYQGYAGPEGYAPRRGYSDMQADQPYYYATDDPFAGEPGRYAQVDQRSPVDGFSEEAPRGDVQEDPFLRAEDLSEAEDFGPGAEESEFEFIEEGGEGGSEGFALVGGGGKGGGGKGGGHYHGHHHGHRHGGYGGGPYFWGYPSYPGILLDEVDEVDVDDIVAEVVRRLEQGQGRISLGGLELLGAEPPGPRTPLTSAQAYELLKRLPVSELQVRAKRAVAELRAWQRSVLADDNARAYAGTLEQALWQKGNGDSATSEEDKRLAYARCVHMAEEALRRFTGIGPGDSYFDTYLETGKQMAELARSGLHAAAGAPGAAFEWLTGIPAWALWTGGAVLVGGVVYGAYKLALAAAPAMVGVAARRYLP